MASRLTHMSVLVITFILVSLLGFAILKFIDPGSASFWQLALFYGAVFIWIFSLTSIMGYYFRLVFFSKNPKIRQVRIATRQGLFLGLLGVTALILQSASIFTFWTAILIFIVLILMELYAVSG